MTRISNVRKTTKIQRSVKAISPVIATLLMIAIAVVASLVAYAWVMGYMGTTTSKAGKAIQIQSFASMDGNLVVYVQNVGQGDVELNQDQSVYVDSVLVSITAPDQLKIPIAQGETVELQTDAPYTAGTRVNIKVTTIDGTFMQITGTGTSTTTSGNVAPSADFTFSATNLVVQFTDASTDSDGTIASHAWTFGDTQTSTETNPSNTYAIAGTYTVRLTVTDNDGATDYQEYQVTVAVGNVAPVADFTFSATNLVVQFTDGSTDSDGTIASRLWAFGDTQTSTATSPSHTYAAAGTYTVRLTVTDNLGLTNFVEHSVTVSAANVAPVADFTFSATNLVVQFTDGSTDSDGTIASRLWAFGDTQTSTATSPSHTYAAAGTYTVRLTVTDNLGLTNFVEHSVTVTAAQAQVTYVSAGTGTGQTGGNDLTPAYPSGLQANDLILLQVVVRDTSTTPTTPAGFSILSTYAAESSGDARQWIYYKFALGTESGSLTVSIPGSSAITAARMYAFRSTALTSFYEGGAFGSFNNLFQTINAQPVTTSGNNRLAVSFNFVTDNIGIGDFTGESGGNWQEAAEYQYDPSGSNDLTLQLQTATMTNTGTISGGSYFTDWLDLSYGVRAFALKP
jgi:flagellin-like protein